VRLNEHGDVEDFLDAADDLLGADEARHNLIYGICATLSAAPAVYPVAHLWTVDDGGTVAAALMTPPFNIVVAKPADRAALPFAARSVHRRGVAVPGVVGALPEVDAFAEAWAHASGSTPRVRMRQGVYAARAAVIPGDVSGELRFASRADRQLLVDWLTAFQAEALPDDAPHVNPDEVVASRLESQRGGLALWMDGGTPVSLCGYGGRTPHGIRIGPVYTPPDLRGRGYASALVARVTASLLESGRDYCFLYTDLANPTSNRIYKNVGYEEVCESADYAFDPCPVR
jgi:GNAT superfamily N-acetyltransferase